MHYLYYPLLGAIAGLMGGMLGIGGGLVVVPGLVLIFTAEHMAPSIMTHMAVGTSLATIVVTSVSAIREHHRRGAIEWPLFRQMAPALMAGSIIGSLIAHAMHGPILQRLFGLFALIISVQMFFNIKPTGHAELPDRRHLSLASVAIGAAASLFGIGGGSLTVPYLSWHKLPIHRAIAVSSACGLPIAFAGALGFAVSGWNAPQLPEHSLGYVFLPALLGISFSSLFFAQWGARLAHRLSSTLLKRFFVGVLFVVGLRLLYGVH